jgi:hypothetical protein
MVVSAKASIIQRKRSGWLFLVAMGIYFVVAIGTLMAMVVTAVK